jgi:hypothetical protein
MQPSAQPKMSDATQIKPQQILPPFASHPSFIWWLAGLELQHAVQFVERSKNLPGTVARLSAEVSSDFGFYTPNMGRPELLIPPPIHWLAQVNWTGAALFSRTLYLRTRSTDDDPEYDDSIIAIGIQIGENEAAMFSAPIGEMQQRICKAWRDKNTGKLNKEVAATVKFEVINSIEEFRTWLRKA